MGFCFVDALAKGCVHNGGAIRLYVQVVDNILTRLKTYGIPGWVFAVPRMALVLFWKLK
jgi:hypothetical protein